MPLSSINTAAQDAWCAFDQDGDREEVDGLLLRCSLGELLKETYTSDVMRSAIDLSAFGIEGVGAHFLWNSARTSRPGSCSNLSTAPRRRARVLLPQSRLRPAKRDGHLNDWLRLSVEAAGVCADQEEFSTQAYALLNKAAALAELASMDTAASQMRTLDESMADIRSAQDLFAMVGDDRGLAWSAIHLARLCARRYELSEGASAEEDLRFVLREMLRASIDAEANSRRIDDEIAQGLASLYLCAAEKEAQRLGVRDVPISDEDEIAHRARRAAAILSATHRLPQAARALQIAAQCELSIAHTCADHSRHEVRLRAMRDLTEAISILDEDGYIDQASSERLTLKLHESVANCVPRWRF